MSSLIGYLGHRGASNKTYNMEVAFYCTSGCCQRSPSIEFHLESFPVRPTAAAPYAGEARISNYSYQRHPDWKTTRQRIAPARLQHCDRTRPRLNSFNCKTLQVWYLIIFLALVTLVGKEFYFILFYFIVLILPLISLNQSPPPFLWWYLALWFHIGQCLCVLLIVSPLAIAFLIHLVSS